MLSVLIVNWNTKDLLRRCLDSLRRFPPSCPMEVIVVDNASTDGSAEMARADFPEVRLLEPGTNTGYALGNNLAFALASGALLLTLNPDTEVFADTLDNAIRCLDRHPDAGALSVRLVGIDGSTQRSVRGFPSLMGIFGDVTGLGRSLPGSALDSYRLSAFDYESEQLAPQPMGTFLLFRRIALEGIGDVRRPFDESFPIFFNEVDLLFRLQAAGWNCVYTPDARLLHHGGESTKQTRKSMIWESHRSLVRFLHKHCRTAWNWPAIWIVSGVIMLAAWLRARGYHAGFGT